MHKGLRLLRRAGLVMVAVGGTALAVPAIASANPNCGSVVTHSIKLSGNMLCHSTSGPRNPSGTAIYVGRDGITINLNGFTVQGDNQGVGIDNAGDWPSNAPGSGGVAGPGTGFSNVTVTNGQVQDFGTGVYYDSTAGGLVSSLLSQYNEYEGVDYENSASGLITGNTLQFNGDDGLYMANNHGVTASNNRSRFNSGAGITDHNSRDTLSGNKANSNGQWGVFVQSPLRGRNRMYRILDNTANNNDLSGFKIDDNTPTTFFQARVMGNTAKNNGQDNTSDGWGFFADAPVVSDTSNQAKNNFAGQCHNVQCTILP